MSKTQRNLNDGDVIFLESDPGGEAYEVIKGSVELSRIGPEGRARLALLNPGQTFGGKESLENGQRTATARALGVTTVKIIPFKEISKDVKKSGKKDGNKKAPAATGIIKRLLKAITLSAPAGRIEIRVAPLISGVIEAAEAQTKHLVAALAGNRKLKARALNNAPPFTLNENPALVAATARQWLARSKADLLIWGEIPHPGTTLHLRFVSAETSQEDIPGQFSLSTTLNLPVDFEQEFNGLFLAVSLAAITVEDEAKSLCLAQLQADALAAAVPVIKSLPRDLTTRERAAIHKCLGNVMAVEAARRNSPDLYQMAAQTYRTALEGLTRDDANLEWAMTNKHLGSVLQGMAERSSDEGSLNAAADAFGEALKVLTKEEHPREWASTQNRLGLALYKIDLITNDTELIKHAITAFQNALQVFNRKETPQLWADAMTNFAQAAQLLGEHLRNPEVLEKAATACRQALKARNKEKAPLQWAATQNNLGSALFLLGKLKKDLTPLKESVEAFKNAHDLYSDQGADKMAAITKKNLSHAERLIEKNAQPNK